MFKRTCYLFCIFSAVISNCEAQSSKKMEYSVHFKNGIQRNNPRGVEANFIPASSLKVSNCFHQSVGLHARRISRHGFEVGLRLDVGYNRYKLQINYPFASYGFKETTVPENYRIEKTVPVVSLGFLLGNRFTTSNALIPEVYYTHNIWVPLAYRYESLELYEQTSSGGSEMAALAAVSIGKSGSDFYLQHSNTLYCGLSFKKSSILHHWSLGVQFDHQLFTSNLPENFAYVGFADADEISRGSARWETKYSSIALLTSYRL